MKSLDVISWFRAGILRTDQARRINDENDSRLRGAGYGDTEIDEIFTDVALNIFPNAFNRVAETVMGFSSVGE